MAAIRKPGRRFQQDDLDPVKQVLQYAPTPGYYGRKPASRCGLSPSPDYHSDNSPEVLSQHQLGSPRLLQLHDGLSNDELETCCIQYR
jgi:hypothetical protein